jgi:antagonist of KipI
MTLLIQTAALMMTVQDSGRYGYQRFGMPESGPMDWWAFRAANRLVGNALDEACLEIGFSNAEMDLVSRLLMAFCGVGYRLFVNQREIPLWMAFMGREGDHIRLEKIPGGNWAYLALAGGIQSNLWMGSRSYYPAGGLGHNLTSGDQIPINGLGRDTCFLAGRSLLPTARPAYGPEPKIRVIPGPHRDRFTEASWDRFWANGYYVSAQSNRMGYRLTGAMLTHKDGADLISQGMALGEIQVPGDGQPIVMMPDHPTTGGYTCIGTVARVDMPLLAQVEPGYGTLRFEPIHINQAVSLWAEAIRKIDSAIDSQEEPWIGL